MSLTRGRQIYPGSLPPERLSFWNRLPVNPKRRRWLEASNTDQADSPRDTRLTERPESRITSTSRSLQPAQEGQARLRKTDQTRGEREPCTVGTELWGYSIA